MNNDVKLLEQKFKTDISNISYTKEELKEHDFFIKNFVFPLDKEIKKDFSNKIKLKINLFFLAYQKLSPNVKDVLKEVFIEYEILYYKKNIENIISKNSFNNANDKKNINDYIHRLGALIGDENTNDYLKEIKDRK